MENVVLFYLLFLSCSRNYNSLVGTGNNRVMLTEQKIYECSIFFHFLIVDLIFLLQSSLIIEGRTNNYEFLIQKMPRPKDQKAMSLSMLGCQKQQLYLKTNNSFT